MSGPSCRLLMSGNIMAGGGGTTVGRDTTGCCWISMLLLLLQFPASCLTIAVPRMQLVQPASSGTRQSKVQTCSTSTGSQVVQAALFSRIYSVPHVRSKCSSIISPLLKVRIFFLKFLLQNEELIVHMRDERQERLLHVNQLTSHSAHPICHHDTHD